MMKKLCVLLASLLVLTSCAACGPRTPQTYSNAHILNTDSAYPILKEEYKDVRLKLMGWCDSVQNNDWKNMTFWKWMNELTGVDFEFDVVNAADWYERLSLSFTTTSVMPDVIFKAKLSPADEIKYSKDGSIIALDDLIDNYMPNLSAILRDNPNIRKMMKSTDGKIYSLPTIYEKGLTHYNQGGIYINSKWLQRVGKSMPTTTDELLDVLRAFKKVDFNGNGRADEIPLQITSLYDLKFCLSFFGVHMMEYGVRVQDDEVKFQPETENFKEGVKFFRTLYSEGLINTDYLTVPYATSVALAQSSDCVGIVIDASPALRVGNKRCFDFEALTPLTSPVNDTPIYPGQQGIDRGTFVITRNCRYPELAARWVDTLYSEEYNMWADVGKEGSEWAWDDEEHTSWSYLKDANTMSEFRLNDLIQWGGGLPYLAHGYTGFWQKQNDPIEKHNIVEKAKFDQYLVPGYYPISFPSTVQTQINLIYNDLNTYVDNLIADTLTGKIDIDADWATICNEYERLDVETYVEILQRQYDRWSAQ